MNYDSFCIAAALLELEETCRGAFVDQVYQPDRLTVVLAFTSRGPRRFWLLGSDARWARSHATKVRRKNPDTPPGFCMLLRKHLSGAHLVEVEQVRFDRITRLTFRRGEETRVLIHEVMGRHSNLILVDEAQQILGAVKMVPPSQTRVRPVLPGLPYVDPPGARPDPRTLSREELGALLEGVTTAEEITRRISGWGTFAAREALARPGSPADVVWELMEHVRAGRFDPRLFHDDADRPKGIWVFPSVQAGWERSEPRTSISGACDAYFTYQESHAAEDALRKTLLAAVDRALRTATIQLVEARDHLDGVSAAEDLRISGELLSSASVPVERGATETSLPNWYDPEQRPLRIELDPQLDLRENAARYFHRYRRAVAAAEAALERIPELEQEEQSVRELHTRAVEADEGSLAALMDEVRRRGLLREAAEGAGPGKAPTSEFPSGVRIKRVPVGRWEVLYGENATSNDYLTTRHARPGDLWLHARAVTGAHVVIRGVTSLDRLPPEVLREAARLAAAHSEAKHSSLVPVDYTFRRYVRKPRGSNPGAVLYSGEKTIHVEPGLR